MSPWSIEAEGDFSTKVAARHIGDSGRLRARATIGNKSLLRPLNGLHRRAAPAFVTNILVRLAVADND